MLIIFTTAPNKEEAESLAHKLVEEKLAACVQIVPKITSFYFWEGAVRKDEEYLLLIKTLREKYDEAETFIKANHSYSVPEIAAIESVKVSEHYLNWLEDTLK
jgi:periplasmic divalent cation tolerance protein